MREFKLFKYLFSKFNLIIVVWLTTVALCILTTTTFTNSAVDVQTSTSRQPDLMSSFVFIEILDKSLCLTSNDCLAASVISSGSGAHISDQSILTAGHVCMRVNILNEESEREGSLARFDIYGTSGYYTRIKLDVQKIDVVNDLCLLKASQHTFAVPLKIRDRELERGDVVFTSSAPRQYYERGNLLITYSGFYAGNSTSAELPNVSVFTLPSTPGSSGSPILSADGEIVSIICLSVIDTTDITLGPRLHAIQKFLQ